MKWLKRAAITVTIIVAAGAAFIYFAFPTYTHRFRLTFEIDDNGQTKVGTGVITVRDVDGAWMPIAQKRWGRSAVGPPPWIKLGDRGLVIAAMQAMPPYKARPYFIADLSFVAYFDAKHGSPKDTEANIREIPTLSGIRELTPDQLPQFIWFPNPQDRNSAQPVAPDEFASVIGPGIRFVRMYVEITTDEPDQSLYAHLPWLKRPGKPGYNKIGERVSEFQIIGGLP